MSHNGKRVREIYESTSDKKYKSATRDQSASNIITQIYGKICEQDAALTVSNEKIRQLQQHLTHVHNLNKILEKQLRDIRGYLGMTIGDSGAPTPSYIS
jgi:hypothetical protein